MRKTLEEFKKFAVKGNVLDLAVAVVMGTAFKQIIEVLVGAIIMPLIGIITGGNNLTTLSFHVKNSVVNYGLFLQAIVDFTIVAFALFLTIKVITRFKKQQQEESPTPPSNQEVLLTEIRDILKNK